jgi:acetyl esterase/lipase
MLLDRRQSLLHISIGYSGVECHLSQLFNISILHVEYRLSPEHPLPAAVEDTVAVYRALLHHNISPSQLLFMGDSAGGGLALLTVQAIITHQLSIPRGIIALSPWTDISASGESHTRNRHKDVMLKSENNHWMVAQLLGPNHHQLSADSPIFSPLFGSFEGFPPMYISVGTAEVLEDDSRRVLKKAQDAGIDVTFEEGLHMMHVYPVFFPFYPEARTTLDNINKWIQTIYS